MGLAVPTATFTGHFSKENILQMTRYAVSIGVPFGDLVNVVTGLAPPPQTPDEWLSLATNVAIDAVGGKVVKAGLKLGKKALGLLKKIYTQCGGDKAVNYAVAAIPVVVAKGAKATGNFILSGLSKIEARSFVKAMGLSPAQLSAVNSAIKRMTSTSTCKITQNGSDVIVQIFRQGHNGYQVIETIVHVNGSKRVIQKAYDLAGKLVHFHPK